MAGKSKGARSTRKNLVDWRQPKLAPMVILYGKEPFFATRALDALRRQARAAAPDHEEIVINAKEYESGQLSIHTSPSLFMEKKLIRIPHLESLTDALIEDLINYLPAPEPDVWIIAAHTGTTRGKKLLDACEKAKVPFVDCQELPRSANLVDLVSGLIRAQGGKVEPRAAQALVDALGSDVSELMSIAEQLLEDSPTPGTLTYDFANNYLQGRVEASAFAVVDAAIAGNVPEAVRLLRHTLNIGTKGPTLTAAFAYRLRQMAKVSGPGRDNGGLPPWQANQARADLRGWTDKALARAIAAVSQTDQAVKGGSRDANHSLEQMTLLVASSRAR